MIAMTPFDDVASPCVQVCTMDPVSGLCRGCFRTINEIAAWSRLSNRDKREVLARVAARQTPLTPPV